MNKKNTAAGTFGKGTEYCAVLIEPGLQADSKLSWRDFSLG